MGGVGLCSSIPSASACGGGGVASASGVVMGSQRIVMSVRANGTTDMVVQVTVPQTTADYGVLIPVPSEPTLDGRPVSSKELDSLDMNTVPYIDYPYDDSGSGIGCACAGGDAGGGGSRGVSVGSTVTIGPVVAVSLTGDNADAVSAWLTEHGFQLPSDDNETLASYVNAGNYFIAIRRSDSAARGGPTSVGVHYTLQGDHRKLSLGFTKIGAPRSLAFTVFVAAPQAVGPSAPFTAMTLNDLDSALLQKNDYTGAVGAAVAAHQSKAFVLESTTYRSSLFDVAPSLVEFMDPNSVITRATTVVDREHLSDDVLFATPFKEEIPRWRTVSIAPHRGRNASVGTLGVLLVAHALRRRSRRR
ncbi:MAG: DUF2330 domain-containing protein [Polyangiaceae bacterium]